MCDCEQVVGLLAEIRDLLAAPPPSSSASSPADDVGGTALVDGD